MRKTRDKSDPIVSLQKSAGARKGHAEYWRNRATIAERSLAEVTAERDALQREKRALNPSEYIANHVAQKTFEGRALAWANDVWEDLSQLQDSDFDPTELCKKSIAKSLMNFAEQNATEARVEIERLKAHSEFLERELANFRRNSAYGMTPAKAVALIRETERDLANQAAEATVERLKGERDAEIPEICPTVDNRKPFSVLKVSMICWKVYFFGRFIGAVHSENAAHNKIRALWKAMQSFMEPQHKRRIETAEASLERYREALRCSVEELKDVLEWAIAEKTPLRAQEIKSIRSVLQKTEAAAALGADSE